MQEFEVAPDPADPRLTRRVRGTDQDGAPVEASIVVERPLALFLDAGNERPFRIEFQGATRSLTAFDWQAHRIWGATASMLVNLRRRLMESHACR